jgi:photosystem II stability/assembly factor-like uncharacterized protein
VGQWASGSGSTVLRTADGGATWQKLTVTPDAVDFRDIDAIDARTAYVLSIGNGPTSRIYKTNDAGVTWTLQFKNEDPKAFFDAMSFWDASPAIVIGYSIAARFCVPTTQNGNKNWVRDPANVELTVTPGNFLWKPAITALMDCCSVAVQMPIIETLPETAC